MTNTYSLAIYAITISKRGERQDTQVLSDYDNGYDFLSEMHDLFKSWCYDSERGDNFIPVNKDLDYAFRIAQNHDNHPLLHRMGRYLKGTIEAGEFGTREDVVNVNTGEVRYSKTRIDAVMRPFYFMFYIPENARIGFLIVERISNHGIASVLTNAILRHYRLTPKENDYVLRIQAISVNRLIDAKMAALKYEAKQIELTNISNADFGISRILGDAIPDKYIPPSLIYRAKGGRRIPVGQFIEKMFRNKKDNDALYIIDNDLKCEDISVVVSIDGKDRTLTLQRIQSLGATMDISDCVEFGDNYYPTFESLDRQAAQLVSYVIEQFPALKNEAE